jgi:hypothetical protein
MVQDRQAVLNPGQWSTFMVKVLEKIASDVDLVEIGHAVNRVKWGIWGMDDYRRLLGAAVAAASRFPHVRFSGPAAIDFEFPFVVAALRQVPSGLRFGALSHHLYVDRRGAPENRQGRFATLEKLAMARAVASRSPACDDALIVSEVNWPLLGTGVYSPVGSPYESPGPRSNDPSVSEDAYADYMVRYLLIALCSGMAERVYWWRLVARGFGLVDDSDEHNWRERPAYRMLQTLVARVGRATFRERTVPGGDSSRGAPCLFRFSRADGTAVGIMHVHGDQRAVELPGEFRRAENAMGEALDTTHGRVVIGGRPVYLYEE